MGLTSDLSDFRFLREQSTWMLLTARSGPLILALLKEYFTGNQTLGSSELLERLNRDRDGLLRQGEEDIGIPGRFIQDLVRSGWLFRRLLSGESEEQYELTLAAQASLRFVDSLARPRSSATESRLNTVVQLVSRLSEETDPNPETRLIALLAEREALDQRIQEVKSGGLGVLPSDRAVERTREIVALAQELSSDFLRVRTDFEELNRTLRQILVEGSDQGGRGRVLNGLFHGLDMIAESESGRAFDSFYQLLMDSSRRGRLEESLVQVLLRPFARDLAPQESDFLRTLTDTLIDQGALVQDMQKRFSRSLRGFVQSQEFLERRRLGSLLDEAQKKALAAREAASTRGEEVGWLQLTGASVRSLGQWKLWDPDLKYDPVAPRDADPPEITLEEAALQIRRSEIDYHSLKTDLREVVLSLGQASLGTVLKRKPAAQGLGSVIGLMEMGTRAALIREDREVIFWMGSDGTDRRATIPLMIFTRERLDEL